MQYQRPNPDKPEQIATKAPRYKAKPLVNIHLCVFVSWWRKCFAIKCKEFTTYTGCHKYVPFAGFSNRRQYNV